jgi:hypothetical protein
MAKKHKRQVNDPAGRLTMTYEAHIVISLNWNIDKRVLLSKTFSFNTFNEACNFFEDRGIPLQVERIKGDQG